VLAYLVAAMHALAGCIGFTDSAVVAEQRERKRQLFKRHCHVDVLMT
jgi:hypothetical protein